jgi:hypothetical protein
VAKTTIPVPRGLTLEDVWVGLMENRQQLKELAKDREKDRLEDRKEADRMTKEIRRNLEEATHLSKENSRQIGGLQNSFG